MHSIGVPGSVVPGHVAPAPMSFGAACPEVSRLYLSGSPCFSPQPIYWRHVGDKAEFACSWVADAERLLYETLVSVNQNILPLIRVSLKKRGKSLSYASGFLNALSSPPVFCLCNFCPVAA
jgi:hypothetical protein